MTMRLQRVLANVLSHRLQLMLVPNHMLVVVPLPPRFIVPIKRPVDGNRADRFERTQYLAQARPSSLSDHDYTVYMIRHHDELVETHVREALRQCKPRLGDDF